MRFQLAILASTAAAYLPTPNPFMSAKSAHCDVSVLKAGCEAISDAGGALSRAEWGFEFDLTPDEGGAFLDKIGVKGAEFSCEALCQQTARHYEHWLPATIDTGCRHVGAVIQCDVDLAEDAIEADFTGTSRNEAKHHVGDGSEPHRREEDPIEVKMQKTAKAVLRAFRSYAYSPISVTTEGDVAEPTVREDEETSLEALVKAKVASSFLQMKSGAATGAWSMACLTNQVFREKSGHCLPSMTHEAVFLQLTGARAPAEMAFVEEDGCPWYCRHFGHFVYTAYCEAQCPAAAPVEAEALPDREVGPPEPMARHSDWKAEVARVSLKAQAYVNKVHKHVRSHYAHELDLWFGDSEAKTRKKVRSVLTSLTEMLDNVDYVYPGDECERNTYAYVYPDSGRKTFNSAGQYKFYLCDTYMNSGMGEKIETLTHEGSHHRSAYTDDVPHPDEDEADDGELSYGRSTCKKLARTDTKEALNNADNYCYFINDAATKHD